MSHTTTEDESFDGIDFPLHPPSSKEFEFCTFNQCNFANADLSRFRFVECTFAGCDLSNAKLMSTTLNDIRFIDCKLLGLHFDNCNDFLFSVSFDKCSLDFSSFYQRQLKNTVFKNCSLIQVDFTDADLSGSSFDDCNLDNAVFDNTNLGKTDFRSAKNFSIDPERNKMKKARFSTLGLRGLLHKYDLLVD